VTPVTFFSQGTIRQESQRHWNTQSDGGHRYADEEWLQKYSAEIEAILPGGGTLVDVGCGACQVTVYLAPRYDRVVGVDFSQAMLNVARIRVDKFNAGNIELMYGDAIKFPESLKCVNAILSYAVVQYLDKEGLRAHLDQCSQVLSSAGVVCIANIPDANRKMIYYRHLIKGRYRRFSWARSVLYLIKMKVRVFFSKDLLWDGIGNWFSKFDVSSAANQACFEVEFHDSKYYEYRFHAVLRFKTSAGG
jgi:cyclopropane-fatty-acyl-phospholipid synthase